MTLWTIQVPEFYNQLMELGYAYCPGIDDFTREYMIYPYNWMAGQMRKRIGEPPLPEIEYPVWAWYQYMGGAQKKPSKVKSALSCGTSEHGYEMLLELNVPDNEVLLSDFDMWHIPLNHSDFLVRPRSRRFMRRVKTYRRDHFSEYPTDLLEVIYRSWERIFDLRPNHKSSYTKYIQATLWWVKKEWLVSAEKLVYTELVDDTIFPHDDDDDDN